MRWALALLALTAFSGSAQQQQEVGKQCLSCHIEYVEDLRSHKHAAKGISCEVCHGDSQQHRNAVGATSPDRVAAPDEVPALCGGCHVPQGKLYATSAHGKLVLSSSKTRAANCGTCHGVHALRNAVAMKRQCDRCHAELPAACKKGTAGESKLVCASCHNPHTLKR
jgi:hypothetical protein